MRLQFQSLTNLPCGLESNNNFATTGLSMDEEDASADDDEHIRNYLLDDELFASFDKQQSEVVDTNGVNNSVQNGVGPTEKLRIDYPRKFHTARSMSLSMERNAFCELCRVSRSPVPFDFGSNAGGERDGDDDKGVRRYFGFTIRQYMALGSLALVDFLGFCSMSVMAPTFPKEVIEKH